MLKFPPCLSTCLDAGGAGRCSFQCQQINFSMTKLLMSGKHSQEAWNMTEGQISSALKITYLHVFFVLHNVEWCIIDKQYYLTILLQMQPFQKYFLAHKMGNTHPLFQWKFENSIFICLSFETENPLIAGLYLIIVNNNNKIKIIPNYSSNPTHPIVLLALLQCKQVVEAQIFWKISHFLETRP